MFYPWRTLHYLENLFSQCERVQIATIEPAKILIAGKLTHHIVAPVEPLPILTIVEPGSFNAIHGIKARGCIATLACVNQYAGALN